MTRFPDQDDRRAALSLVANDNAPAPQTLTARDDHLMGLTGRFRGQ